MGEYKKYLLIHLVYLYIYVMYMHVNAYNLNVIYGTEGAEEPTSEPEVVAALSKRTKRRHNEVYIKLQSNYLGELDHLLLLLIQ